MNNEGFKKFITAGKITMSKRFIVISVSILLIAACNRPFAASTVPAQEIAFAQPMATATPTALFNMTNSLPTHTPSVVTATAEGSCSSAPVSHVEVGQQVTVTVENWDKLKLRSKPEISAGTVLIDLDQYTQLEILDGPICVSSPETKSSYLFWKVKVLPGGEIGWVAEGDDSHYYIERAHG
jgi:hypothetical protein